MSRHLVFVYGTLKIGQPNHYLLTDPENGHSDFVGRAKTVKKWPLVIASKYNIPYLLYQKDFGEKISGEIYSVDDRMLAKMDELECHPTYYTRLETPVVLDDGTETIPWIYFIKNFRSKLLELPTLDSYSSYGSHGLPYVTSEETSTLDDMNE